MEGCVVCVVLFWLLKADIGDGDLDVMQTSSSLHDCRRRIITDE